MTPKQKIAKLQDLVQADSTNALAWYWLGVIAQRDLKDLTTAKTAYAKLLALDTDLKPLPDVYRPWFYFWQGSLAETEGRVEDAISAMQQTITRDTTGKGPTDLAKKALQRLTTSQPS